MQSENTDIGQITITSCAILSAFLSCNLFFLLPFSHLICLKPALAPLFPEHQYLFIKLTQKIYFDWLSRAKLCTDDLEINLNFLHYFPSLTLYLPSIALKSRLTWVLTLVLFFFCLAFTTLLSESVCVCRVAVCVLECNCNWHYRIGLNIRCLLCSHSICCCLTLALLWRPSPVCRNVFVSFGA